MPTRFRLCLILALAGLAACSTAPVSFEDSLTTERATRNDVPDWDTEMRYRVSFQYARAAHEQFADATLEIPPDTSFGFQVPFAILDFTLDNNLGGAIGFADWFNSGMNDNARYRHYYTEGVLTMTHPSTHYFSIDTRPGEATAEDIHTSWDEAHALFQAVHNRSGRCYVYGFNDKDQYRVTFSKDVPGLYKEISYRCPHPYIVGEELRVLVSAWARPFPDARAIGAVQMRCWVTPPRGEKFRDLRPCGRQFADQHRASIPDSRFGWMELMTTPKADEPHHFEVLGRIGDHVVRLPAPEITEEYVEFLAAQPYAANE